MKKFLLALAVIAALVVVIVLNIRPAGSEDEQRPQPGHAAAPETATAEPQATAAAETQAPAPAANPSKQGSTNMPEPSERFVALLAELRPKVDAALRESDFEAADRHVDEVLAAENLEALEKQRLMVVKLGTRGMRGDHAAMLDMMDEIIAVDPTSPLALQLLEERPKVERVHQLGPDHPDLCETCGQEHPPGMHPKTQQNPPQD